MERLETGNECRPTSVWNASRVPMKLLCSASACRLTIFRGRNLKRSQPSRYSTRQNLTLHLPGRVPLRIHQDRRIQIAELHVSNHQPPRTSSPQPEEHLDETLNLGDLRDICRIRMF